MAIIFQFCIFAGKYLTMKFKFYALLSVIVFAACAEEANYEISGTLQNATEGQKIYVSALDGATNQPKVIDTLEVVDGKFSADLPEVEEPTISFLNMEGVMGNVFFIADNTPISFEVFPDSLYATKIEGGTDNKILTDYTANLMERQRELLRIRNSMMESLSAQDNSQMANLQNEQEEVVHQMQLNKKDLVEKNPNSVISLMVLQEMIGSRMFETSELKSLYENLTPELKSSQFAKTVEKDLSNLSLVEIGNKAPDFTAPTPEGEMLALNEVLGKVTLIDFWASWCKPCRMENPNIVRVYEKYHDKGFNAIGVSLDREGAKDKWIQAIAEDNLGWAQVSNLQFWQDPVARQYGIRSIPAAFLLDENGVIVAKNLRGEALERKVAELLGEE